MVNLKVDIPMVIVGVHFAGSFVYPSNSIFPPFRISTNLPFRYVLR